MTTAPAAAVQVNDVQGKSLGNIRVGETVGLALQGLIFGAGGLCDKDDIILQGEEVITLEGGLYVFMPLQVVQPPQDGELCRVLVFLYSNVASNTEMAALLFSYAKMLLASISPL
jgi:hypothetical protein